MLSMRGMHVGMRVRRRNNELVGVLLLLLLPPPPRPHRLQTSMHKRVLRRCG